MPALVKKTKDWAGALTDSCIWDPTPNTFVLTGILINATASCTVTIFDQNDNTTYRIFKANMATGQTIVIVFEMPLESAAASRNLKITTSGVGGRCTVYGYEI